jgi:hypothetical protein
MSVRGTATINVPLTSYAQGIASDRIGANRLAQILSPIVQVGAAVGTYKVFNDKNSFLIEDDARALGGQRKRLQFEAGDAGYSCKPRGLEIGMDDFESDLVSTSGGAQRMALLEQGKVKSLVARKSLGYCKRVVDAFFAGYTVEGGLGKWSDPAIDPIDQLDEVLSGLSLDVSSSENITLVMSLTAWKLLRRNEKVKKRLGLNQFQTLTRPQLLDALVFPVSLEISSVTYTTKKFGQAAVGKGDKVEVIGSYAAVLQSQPNPTEFDVSPFKTFSTSSALVDSVKTYRDESSNSDVHAVDWSEDIKQTSTLSARTLAIS